jgi:hypothetical protein
MIIRCRAVLVLKLFLAYQILTIVPIVCHSSSVILSEGLSYFGIFALNTFLWSCTRFFTTELKCKFLKVRALPLPLITSQAQQVPWWALGTLDQAHSNYRSSSVRSFWELQPLAVSHF